MISVFVGPSAATFAAGASCLFKLLTSAFRSAFCFSNSSTARSSFSIRALSDDCARSGCAVSKTVAARLTPAARKLVFLMSMSLSLGNDGFGLLRKLASSKQAGILVIFPPISAAISITKEWQYKNRQILCKLFFGNFQPFELELFSSTKRPGSLWLLFFAA